MTFKPPRVDAHKTYVMKRIDRDEFVSQLTPMLDSPYVGNAHRFDGKWLNDGTCWRWWTYHVPVEVGEAIKLYDKPLLPKRNVKVTTKLVRKLSEKTELEDLKRVVRKTPVTAQQHKKNERVRIKSLKKTKAHAKTIRRVLKATRKRR